MGQVSRGFILIGLIPLMPAIILTFVSVFFPASFPDTPWFNIIVRAFAIGLLYVVAFAFIILGIIVAIRDSE
ncbi:MAG: hypothetical protein ACM3UN_01785 [Bacillota bacterium]